MSDFPDMPRFVALAITDYGREANLRDIYHSALRSFPEWNQHYKNEESFQASIRHTLESYCPQSANYSVEREPLFQKVDQGRYRVLGSGERALVWKQLRNATQGLPSTR